MIKPLLYALSLALTFAFGYRAGIKSREVKTLAYPNRYDWAERRNYEPLDTLDEWIRLTEPPPRKVPTIGNNR